MKKVKNKYQYKPKPRKFKKGEVYRPQAFVMKVSKAGKPLVLYMGGQVYGVIDDNAKNPFK